MMSADQVKGLATEVIDQTASPKGDPTERLTFEEYLIKYADVHAEWFPDGHVEVLTGNNSIHTRLLGFLYSLLDYFLARRGLGEVLMSGTGMSMRLDPSLPARVPDLTVLLTPNVSRLRMNFIDGPVDVAVEIVSPESDIRDHGEKLVEFEQGGVPEYWLIDPLRSEATFYGLGADRRYHPLPRDAKGRLTSRVLPGFALPVEVLWQEVLPRGEKVLPCVDAMEDQ